MSSSFSSSWAVREEGARLAARLRTETEGTQGRERRWHLLVRSRPGPARQVSWLGNHSSPSSTSGPGPDTPPSMQPDGAGTRQTRHAVPRAMTGGPGSDLAEGRGFLAMQRDPRRW